MVHPTCGDGRCGRPHPQVGGKVAKSANHHFCAAPARRPTHTVELVSAFRHLQSAADMCEWSERVMSPQVHPARAHAKAMPLTSKVVRSDARAQRGCVARAPGRFASTHKSPSVGLTTKSKRTGHSRLEVAALMCAPPPQLPCQGAEWCRRFDSWLRLAVKERRCCGGGRPEKVKSRKKQPSHLIQCCVLSHMGRFRTKNMDSSCG